MPKPIDSKGESAAAFDARRPIVVVTGAVGALGSEVSRHLAHAGWRVVVMGRAGDALDKLAREVGGLAVGADLTQQAAWDEAIARIEKELGAAPSAAALIAGGWQGGAKLAEAKDDERWRAMMTMNTETVYRSLRALLPQMVKARAGSIVVVGSRAVEQPWTGAGAAEYAASKAAAVALARAVAAEVLAFGVRVNAILPSTIDTAANRRAMPGADPSRWVTPASIAGLVEFLLSERSRDVSGAAIPIYGSA